MLVKIKILKAVDMLNYDESEEYIMNTADSIRLLDGTMVLVADLQTDTALGIIPGNRMDMQIDHSVQYRDTDHCAWNYLRSCDKREL